MRLRKPYIDQIVVSGTNGSGGRYLHALTYFPGALYQSDGFEPIPSVPNAQGVYPITLKVKKLGDTNPEVVTATTHIVPLPAAWPEGQKVSVGLTGHDTGSPIPLLSEDDPDETVKSLTSEDDPDETVKSLLSEDDPDETVK